MIAFFLGAGIRILALAGLLYLAFFVPLGQRTLYGHLSNIAGTEEARELQSAVQAEVVDAQEAVRARIAAAGNHVAPRP